MADFVELLSKPLARPRRCAWSQTMDLLAWATTNTLYLHRLSWQRLLSVALDESGATLECFAWSPSGKMFAAVSSSGVLNVWSTESGALKHRRQLDGDLCDGGACLSWASRVLADGALAPFESAARAHFKGSFAMVLDVSGDEPLLFSKIALEPDASLEIAVVCVGNAVELRASGAVRVGRVELGADARARHAWLTADFAQLVVVTCANETASVWSVATPLLASHAAPLAALATHAINVASLCAALEHSLRCVRKQWERVVGPVVDTVEALQRRLRESQAPENVGDALVDILLCGTRVAGSEMWLETEMSERVVAKLSKHVKEAGGAVTDALEGTLLDLSEQLCYRVAEWQALYARHAQRLCALTGGANPFVALAAQCDAVYAQVEATADAVVKQRALLQSYCNWLWRTQCMAAFVEAVASGDAQRRKDAEASLDAHRVAEPFDELLVANFAEALSVVGGAVKLLDVVPMHFGGALEGVARVAQMQLAAMDAMAAVRGAAPARKVFDVPCESLADADLRSDASTGRVTLLLQRGGDDLALVQWIGDAAPLLSVYDAPAGAITAAQWYKGDDSMLVLCYDEDERKSQLHLVREGNEDKTRDFAGRYDALAVSVRGLGAVFGANVVRVLDLEAEADDEDGAAADGVAEAMDVGDQ